jgi:hypothetical protein
VGSRLSKMPIHELKLKDNPRRVVVEYNGEKANVDYNENALSTREWRQIRSRSKSDGETVDDEFSVAVLSRIIIKWDVIRADKTMYPITKEALDDLPPQFLNAVVKAIVEAMFPNSTPPSDTGSSFT